jgi:hypothetical protein
MAILEILAFVLFVISSYKRAHDRAEESEE